MSAVPPGLTATARRPTSVFWFLGTSLLMHPTFALALSLLPASEARREVYAPIEVHISEAPKPPEPPPPPVPPPPPPAKPELPPSVPAPKPVETEPPLEEASPEPAPTSNEAPPRRVVGISMESTTTGGRGPALAVGNTRAGATPEVAEAPAAALPPPPSFVPPVRTLAREPVYPSALRSRNIEGEVGLRVEIDETGHVARVSVTRRSEHPEFDRAAIDSARESTFAPARRDGLPVSHAIEFTVRFRLH